MIGRVCGCAGHAQGMVEQFDCGRWSFHQRLEKRLADVLSQAGHAQVVGHARFEAHAVPVAAAIEDVGAGEGFRAVAVMYGCNQSRVHDMQTLQGGRIVGASDVAGQQRFSIGFDGDDNRNQHLSG